MNKLLLSFLFALGVTFLFCNVQPIGAYVMKNTECDYLDPNFAGPDYCQNACVGELSNNNIVWCPVGNYKGECVDELNHNGTANACNCTCTNPAKDIQCINDSQFDARFPSCVANNYSCVAGECRNRSASPSPGAVVQCNPLLSGNDCWINSGGPCDPNDPINRMAYCLDDGTLGDQVAGDNIGRCQCSNLPDDPGTNTMVPKKLCEFADPIKQAECQACLGVNQDNKKIWTALGCIPVDPQGFVETVLVFSIGIAGGIAFLMILYGGFSCMLAAGNPEKLNSCKEIITSAITGLLLVIFSTVILKIIGIDILGGLPGFGL